MKILMMGLGNTGLQIANNLRYDGHEISFISKIVCNLYFVLLLYVIIYLLYTKLLY